MCSFHMSVLQESAADHIAFTKTETDHAASSPAKVEGKVVDPLYPEEAAIRYFCQFRFGTSAPICF